MIKGITEKEENIIKNILKDYSFNFFYYGSRVKGDYTKNSDLDILSMDEIDYSTLEEINLKFNKSTIPYVVNISQYSKMDEKFYNLIKPYLVKIFD